LLFLTFYYKNIYQDSHNNNFSQIYCHERISTLHSRRYGYDFKRSLLYLPKSVLLQMFSLSSKRSYSHHWHSQTDTATNDQELCNRRRSTLTTTQDDGIEDSIKLMILIYLCLDESIPKKFIHRCQINPDHATESYRTDLQFYVHILECRYLNCATI
jgi:hypothetical protein